MNVLKFKIKKKLKLSCDRAYYLYVIRIDQFQFIFFFFFIPLKHCNLGQIRHLNYIKLLLIYQMLQNTQCNVHIEKCI